MTQSRLYKPKRVEKSPKAPRQSNMELLRIVAMLMVVAHHFVRYANPPLDAYPLGVRWLFFFVLETGGEVGVAVFLGISLWFLTQRNLTVHEVRRHLIKTEAVLLSYSMPLFFVSKFALHCDGPQYFFLRSLFPTISSLWWFMTTYAVLLLFLPFLLHGLHSLGRHMHAQLVYVVVVVVGTLPMLSFASLPVSSLTAFFALAVVVSYVRWYPSPVLERPGMGWALFIGSLALGVGLGVLVKLFPMSISNNDPMRWEWSPGGVLVMGEALGLLLVFARLRIQSRAINFVAPSTVGVYLLHEHPVIKGVLWDSWLPFGATYASPFWLPRTVAVVVGVFAACVGVDLVRRGVFWLATYVRHMVSLRKGLRKG
ncbi:MAG: acyltransferase [Atopobiaceae bacterium]|nr:acyltransferase [Atopobiaceae bacterium]